MNANLTKLVFEIAAQVAMTTSEVVTLIAEKQPTTEIVRAVAGAIVTATVLYDEYRESELAKYDDIPF